MIPFESSGTVSYSHSIVIMAYLVSFSRQSETLVENRNFCTPLAFNAPVRAVPIGILPKTFEDTFSLF